MAIYRLSMNAISRSGGKSVAASVAYDARTTVHDRRTGQKWRYPNRGDRLYSEIIAPPSPFDWARKRGELWNKVEEVENRKDSTTARTFTIALPDELSIEQQIQLVRQFVREQFTERGLIVDWSLHNPDRKFELGKQPHAHLTATTRAFDPISGAFSSRKSDWLNKKTTRTEETLALREAWANACNFALEAADSKARVSHLSRDAQRQSAQQVARDATKSVAARIAAAQTAAVMAIPPEPKIGQELIAKAARRYRRDEAIGFDEDDLEDDAYEIPLTLEDALRASSPLAAATLNLRAKRVAVVAAIPKWTEDDEIALRQAEVHAAQAERDVELAARIYAERGGWLAMLDRVDASARASGERYQAKKAAEIEGARAKLAADRARLDDATRRLDGAVTVKLRTARADLGRTWKEIVEFNARRTGAPTVVAKRPAKPAQKRVAAELLQGDVTTTLILSSDRAQAQAVQQIERGWSRPQPGALILPAPLFAAPPAKVRSAIERHKIFGSALASAKHLIRLATDATAPLIATIWPAASERRPAEGHKDFAAQLAADNAARHREQQHSLSVALARWPRLVDQLDPDERAAWRDDLSEIADDLRTMQNLALGAINAGDSADAWAAIEAILERVDAVAINLGVNPPSLDGPADDDEVGYRPP